MSNDETRKLRGIGNPVILPYQASAETMKWMTSTDLTLSEVEAILLEAYQAGFKAAELKTRPADIIPYSPTPEPR